MDNLVKRFELASSKKLESTLRFFRYKLKEMVSATSIGLAEHSMDFAIENDSLGIAKRQESNEMLVEDVWSFIKTFGIREFIGIEPLKMVSSNFINLVKETIEDSN